MVAVQRSEADLPHVSGAPSHRSMTETEVRTCVSHAEAARSQTSIARRAGVGAVLVAGRTIIAQFIAVVATMVLAHHLSAAQFGVLGVGTALTMFATAFADVGLAAGLIRGGREPSRSQLRSALGLQLSVMAALGSIAALAVAPFGRVALVTDLMLVSLPMMAWQTPARVVLERALDYRRIAAVELAQSIAYSAWAVGAVIAGWGIWAVASATVAQAAVGLVLYALLVVEGRLVPRVSLSDWRGLSRFGVQFQAITFTNLIRDHGLALAVGAVLGLPALGVWNVASRVMRLPLALFGAVWRVSYPTMAKVVRDDSTPAELLERAIAVAAVACGLLLVPIAGSALLAVPVLFGHEWRDVGLTVAPSCVALMVGGPISLATGGYLYAVGAVRSILVSAVLHTFTWFVVALPLLPLLGVPAVGIAWIAGSAVDAAILGRAASARSGARTLDGLWLPLLVGLVASGMGFGVALRLTASPIGVVATAGGSFIAYVSLLGIAIKCIPGQRFVVPIAELVQRLVSTLQPSALVPSAAGTVLDG
jgi:O-antigen/teichoic acid export membrane protein